MDNEFIIYVLGWDFGFIFRWLLLLDFTLKNSNIPKDYKINIKHYSKYVYQGDENIYDIYYGIHEESGIYKKYSELFKKYGFEENEKNKGKHIIEKIKKYTEYMNIEVDIKKKHFSTSFLEDNDNYFIFHFAGAEWQDAVTIKAPYIDFDKEVNGKIQYVGKIKNGYEKKINVLNLPHFSDRNIKQLFIFKRLLDEANPVYIFKYDDKNKSTNTYINDILEGKITINPTDFQNIQNIFIYELLNGIEHSLRSPFTNLTQERKEKLSKSLISILQSRQLLGHLMINLEETDPLYRMTLASSQSIFFNQTTNTPYYDYIDLNKYPQLDISVNEKIKEKVNPKYTPKIKITSIDDLKEIYVYSPNKYQSLIPLKNLYKSDDIPKFGNIKKEEEKEEKIRDIISKYLDTLCEKKNKGYDPALKYYIKC